MRERVVIKRDGRKVPYDRERITVAMSKAVNASEDREFAAIMPKLTKDV